MAIKNEKDFDINDVKVVTFSNGVSVINTTPHNCTFQDNDELIQVPSSVLLNAIPTEKVFKSNNGVDFVISTFKPDESGYEIVRKLRTAYPNVLIIGSAIACQAYPEDVVGMVSVEGYERVAPDLKRMRIDKFSVFPKN